MGEVDIVEKLIAGTLGTTAVLGTAVWLLWGRLNARESDHAAAMERKDQLIVGMVDKMTAAMGDLQRAVTQNTYATEGLRDAIERGTPESSRRRVHAGSGAERVGDRD